jgi:glycosyltransferase domain-containing protein
MTDPRLTIVMPLKGRPLYTLRFLWFANRLRLPFHIIVTDGEVREPLAGAMDGIGRHFPNLSLEYIRNVDDSSYPLYLEKMRSAVERVKTPYVMLADNDDYPLLSGILASLDFLEKNPDYVACSGRRGGFSLDGPFDQMYGVTGDLTLLAQNYSEWDEPRNIDAANLSDRLDAVFRGFSPGSYYCIYYHITRREAALQLFREEVEIAFTDAELRELYRTVRLLTFGKACTLPDVVSYIRQHGTSIRIVQKPGQMHFQRDWVDLLLDRNYTKDFREMVARLARVIGEHDNMPTQQVAARLRDWYAKKLRHDLRVRFYTEHRLIALLKAPRRAFGRFMSAHAPALAKGWKRWAFRTQTRRFWNAMRSDGADASHIATLRGEIALMRDVSNRTKFIAMASEITPSLLPQKSMP